MKKNHLIFALLTHIIAAWFSYGRFHPDEQFQIIEFLGYKTGVNSAQDLPWEFHSEMRGTTQVAFAYGITKVFSFIQNPFTLVFIFRLIGSLLALYVVHRLTRYFKSELTEKNYNSLSILTALYCFVPFFHARFSSENLSISVLLLGVVLFLEAKKIRIYILVGALLGLAYTTRMQSLFLIFGFGLWALIIKKLKFNGVLLLTAGFSISILIGLLSDRWFYGHWVNTTWNYVYENIILHKSENFGTQPFWYYFEKTFLDAIPPLSIVIILSFLFLFVFKIKHLITWMVLPFLLVHFFTAHKELRFIFPLINLIPLVVILCWQEVENNIRFDSLKRHLIRFKFYFIKPIFWTVNSILLLILCFKPADNYTPPILFLYNAYGSIKTQIFYTDNNPYDKNNCLNFYKSEKMNMQQFAIDTIKKIDFSNCSYSLVVASEEEVIEINKNGFSLKKVYSTIPDFLKYFNVNNWISRTRKTEIYQIVRK